MKTENLIFMNARLKYLPHFVPECNQEKLYMASKKRTENK